MLAVYVPAGPSVMTSPTTAPAGGTSMKNVAPVTPGHPVVVRLSGSRQYTIGSPSGFVLRLVIVVPGGGATGAWRNRSLTVVPLSLTTLMCGSNVNPAGGSARTS